MNLKRIVFCSSVVVLVAAAVITIFTSYLQEKPFYQRLKGRKKRIPYKLRNITFQESKIYGDLIQGGSTFTLTLSFASKEIIHFQINDPFYPRHVVHDVVTLEPKILTSEDITITRNGIYLQVTYQDLKVIIDCDDFQINLYKKDKIFLLVNSQKFFAIEEKEPWVGIGADFFFVDALRAYGLSQHAEKMSLTPTAVKPYRLYNTDRFAYSSSNPHESLYGTVPLVYAHGANQTTGLLWLNSSETYVDIDYSTSGVTSVFFSESGAADFFVLAGSRYENCVRQYTELTGSSPLPPLFALGYHQCRYSYMSQEEVIEVSDKFDENDFPLDSIWMDIDYTDDIKYFTWNPTTYSNPDQMLEYLEKKKRKAVCVIDPHIKVDDDYFVYSHCKKERFFVKNPNGSIFTAKCFSGTSSWIDFFNPEARRFYSDLHESFAKAPNLHIWNDMNEPALFGMRENAMPKNVLHYRNLKHRDVHNLYGFYQTMASYKGLLNRPNLRPFILTRSHFAGSQRFAAIWTGDNTATWQHLKISIPMCITASLTGFSLCGADIGGFVNHPDEELLQRWYQLGTWLPFFRNHSNLNVPRREPYLYDKSVQKRIRSCLQQRYKHLLHWYSLFWQHCSTLQPVIRPLIYQYPNDENVLDLDNQFLVGENILVCPVTESKASIINVYLPGEEEVWYNFEHSMVQIYQSCGYITLGATMDTVPVFYRGGSIIPIVEKPVKTSAFLKNCPITLYIFCDKKGKSNGTLFYDDFESFRYLKNNYNYIRIDLDNSEISNVQINQNSTYSEPIILNSVNLYGYQQEARYVKVIQDGIVQNEHEMVESKDGGIRITNLDINLQESFTITLLND